MSPAREPVTRFEGPAVALDRDDIDTDQIIPARFLTTTSRAGMGAHLFADWRRGPDGSARADFILNRPESAGATVLVTGRNFGCGSSREHAAWALADHGFRAIVARSFADIFRQNALNTGLLPIVLPEPAHGRLLARVEREPGAAVTVDLARQLVVLPDGERAAFAIDAFSRECLMAGLDAVGYVLAQEPAIAAFERRAHLPIGR